MSHASLRQTSFYFFNCRNSVILEINDLKDKIVIVCLCYLSFFDKIIIFLNAFLLT